jgi:hypothetical protein
VASESKTPLLNNRATIGSLSTIRPTMEGIVMNNTRFIAWANVALTASKSLDAACLERLGKIAVAVAIANMPKGNCTSRSA